MNHLPLITIITSAFNDCDLLKETISNIQSQTYSHIEYIVIDGGSKDGTIELLQTSDAVTHWISESDSGIYDAWNKALKLSRGDYIAFLGAGDRYLDDGLNGLALLAANDEGAEFIYGKVSVEAPGQRSRIIGRPWAWSLFRRYMCTTHVGALHSRKLFDQYGLFDSSYRIAGDYEFLLRPGKSLKTAFLDKAVATMLAGGISQRNHQVLYEVRRAKLQHRVISRIAANYDFVLAYVKLFVRQKILN